MLFDQLKTEENGGKKKQKRKSLDQTAGGTLMFSMGIFMMVMKEGAQKAQDDRHGKHQHN